MHGPQHQNMPSFLHGVSRGARAGAAMPFFLVYLNDDAEMSSAVRLFWGRQRGRESPLRNLCLSLSSCVQLMSLLVPLTVSAGWVSLALPSRSLCCDRETARSIDT